MPERLIDLRSDTVTRPTAAMREAMARAEVGDDVLGEDPTVNALEERAAALLGKEAGLFVSSGTMGNLVSLMAHLERGHEAIAGREHHLVIDEAAGHAVVVGASIRALEDRPDGTMDPAEIVAAFRDPNDFHEPISGLIALENTHAHSMGQPLPPAYIRQVGVIAREHGVPLHIDGARFWNAVIASRAAASHEPAPSAVTASHGPGSPGMTAPPTGPATSAMTAPPVVTATPVLTAANLAAPADTVTFCLSKGLGCPVGSVVVGSRAVITRARRARKLLGGGMRQAGVLAAAGLVALQDGDAGMIERLADDHANARRLAEGLADLDGIESAGGSAQPTPGRLDPDRVRTNFVLFKVTRDRAIFLAALRARNVLMVEYPHGQVRAVTHHDVTSDDIDTTIRATRDALAETRLATPIAAR